MCGLALAAGACATHPQEDLARRLSPARLGPAQGAAPPPTRTLRARVWADEAHRRSVLGWQVRFHRTVSAANPVLAAGLGIEIEVVSMKPWPHEGGRGARLDEDLSALAAHDAGESVDLVIGLVPSLGAFTANLHDLGKARVLGKHVVLRAMDDLAEQDALTRRLDELPADRRAEVYQARVRHREAALLLHEIGHCLGALHVLRNDRMMSPTWSPTMRAFAPSNLSLMGLVLEGRGRGAEAEAEALARALAFVRAEPDGGWMEMEREALIGLLTAPASARAYASDAPRAARLAEEGRPPPRDPEADTLASNLTGEGRRALQDVLRLNAEGDVDTAWQLLLPMLDAQPRDPAVAMTACEIAYRRAPEAAVERCRVAVEVTESEPAAPMLLEGALAAAGDVAAARSAGKVGEKRLAAGGPPPERAARLWSFHAQNLMLMRFVTRAVAAAERGDSEIAGRLAERARALRRALFLTEEGGPVPEDDEPTYFALAEALHAALSSRRPDAVAAADEALREAGFGAVPGPAVTVCGYFAQAKRWADAARVCRRAVKHAPDAVEPRLGLAFAQFGQRRPGRAVAPLEAAVRLAPDKRDVWQLLSAAYEAAGQRGKQAALRRRYRARFGEALR